MNSDLSPRLSWAADTDLNKAREIQRLAEIRMEDVQALAISGDGRAATLAAAMSAVSAGLLVTAVTLLTSPLPAMPVVLSLLASGAMFIAAAALALLSAKPVDFYHRGYSPDLLAPQQGSELQIVKWVVEDLAGRMQHNDRVLERAGRLMNASYGASAAGVALPLIVTVVRLLS